MARLGFAPLFLILLPAPGWAQSWPNAGTVQQRATQPERSEIFRRDFTIGESRWDETDDRISISTQLGPNFTGGLGMFGQKRDKGYQKPVTGRELDLPKSRRAGVGFSLKF
ncbi:MAG TPA: hypothetical protein VFO12_11120 [Sphingomicrobium sp.]|nr:hypothetical protein [Sphingomicrobium sp.]